MTGDVLLSIVIPVWNRGPTVVEAVRSIAGLRDADAEVIVVDDGSTDGTPDLLEAAIAADGLEGQARVIRQVNAGPSAARNTGAAAARGTWLAFLDSDDIWFDWTLSILSAQLRGRTEPALIFLQTTEEDTPAPPASLRPDIDTHVGFLMAFMAMRNSKRHVVTGSCNAVIDRASFLNLGGFDAALWHSEDIDLFIRAHTLPCLLVHAPPMLRYQTHGGGNLSAKIPNMVTAIRHFDARYRRDADALFGAQAPVFREYFSGIVAHGIRRAFANGYGLTAYWLVMRYMRDLLGRPATRWRMVARMLATPLLALIKPQHYRFRLMPLR